MCTNNKQEIGNSIPVLQCEEQVGNWSILDCGARINKSDLNNYPKLFECSKCENGKECCFTLEGVKRGFKTAVELGYHNEELSATQLEKQVGNDIETSEVTSMRIKCPNCDGFGGWSIPEDYKPGTKYYGCGMCSGTGEILPRLFEECPECHGKKYLQGEGFTEHCKNCNQTGIVKKKKTIREVWSGMQDGADLAGLEAAKECGIKTGGMAPKNYYTKHGSDRLVGEYFGLQECQTFGYPPRTEYNAANTDATIRFATDFTTAGERCTLNAIKKHGKPYLDILVGSTDAKKRIIDFIKKHEIKTLNIAGNSNQQTHDYTYQILCEVFRTLD